MKKTVIIMILALVCVGMNAQGVQSEWKEDFLAAKNTAYVKDIEENGDATMMVEIDLPADKLYRFCREWFATKYSSYKQAAQLEDKENGKLIVNCNYPLEIDGSFDGSPITMSGTCTFKATCDFREGRFRVKATEYMAQYGVIMQNFPLSMQRGGIKLTNTYPQAKDASGVPAKFELQYRQLLSGIVASMKAYIEKAAKDDDF